jgi:intracellular sulfur oxidation DsrE/DsrF family protein
VIRVIILLIRKIILLLAYSSSFLSMNRFLCLAFMLVGIWAYAQTPPAHLEPQFPLVKGFGGIYPIENAVDLPNPKKHYKIFIELVTASDTPETAGRMLLNVARMMNLHGIAGVPARHMEVIVMVHGPATHSLLQQDAYHQRYGVANPNVAVYEALQAAGVRVMVCGQSLLMRGVDPQELWPSTEVALSSLTTITTYVPKGYVLLKF